MPKLLPLLDTRLALRPAEAAAALGVSERALREIAPELPRIHLGRAVLYPVDGLKAWLVEHSEPATDPADAIARELEESLALGRH